MRASRRSASLTQEQLADLAGVHVRTVRGLETGRIRSPRRATVDLLARALGLDVSAHIGLLTTWGLGDVGPIADAHPPLRTEHRSELESILAERATESTPISVTERVCVGADRSQVWRRTEETIVALRPAVVARSVLYDPEDPEVDVVQIHLSDVENGQVVRERVDQDRRCKMFEISLGRSLSTGQSHILRYSMNLEPGQDGEPAVLPTQGQAIGGFMRPPASFVLEVRFDEAALPGPAGRSSRPDPPVRRDGWPRSPCRPTTPRTSLC